MTKPNPNPKRISVEMWKFWLWFEGRTPGAKLGGIYADKPGYHNARENLPFYDYSRRRPADLQGDKTKSCAIDLTLSPSQMHLFSARLLHAGKTKDPRTVYLREFYGNVGQDGDVEGWDFQRKTAATSDSSHLWHIHISIVRKYVNFPFAYEALKSILNGESLAAWKRRTAPKPKPAAPVFVNVKKGESLSAIAAKHKLSLAQLLALNPHKKRNPNSLDIGERIRVR